MLDVELRDGILFGRTLAVFCGQISGL